MKKINNESMIVEMMDILVDMSEETFNETVGMFDEMEKSKGLQNFLDALVIAAEIKRAEKVGA